MEKKGKKILKKKKKLDKQVVVNNRFSIRHVSVIILIIIATSSFGYIGYEKYQENSFQKEQDVFDAGARYGIETVATKIFDIAVTCNEIPINNGSLEINLIAKECLIAPSTQ